MGVVLAVLSLSDAWKVGIPALTSPGRKSRPRDRPSLMQPPGFSSTNDLGPPRGRKVAMCEARSWPTARTGPRDCSVIKVAVTPESFPSMREGRGLSGSFSTIQCTPTTPVGLLNILCIALALAAGAVLRVRVMVLLQCRNNLSPRR